MNHLKPHPPEQAMHNPLINVATLIDWRSDSLARQIPLVILDARARLGEPAAGRQLWAESHIPGACHADMDRDLSAPPNARAGRHPLPEPATFTETLRRWGITPEHRVVVYDDRGGRMAAARAWWMLNWAGHPQACVLDGGWPAWIDAGQVTETAAQATAATPSDWQPAFDSAMLASADDVARGDATLVDARAPERFSGACEPMDAAAGHIPGARNLPAEQTVDDKLRFIAPRSLAALLPAGDNGIAYCGSGISACQIVMAHAVAGRALPRLYAGSWSAWSSDPSRSVVTGNDP